MKTTFRLFCVTFLFMCANASNAITLINGIAVHSELGQESFIGALFTETLSNESREILLAQEEKQIQVRVLASRISARRFKRAWIEGLAINASAKDLEAQSKNMAAFSNMLKVSLKRGDIFAVQRGKDSVKIVINGSTLGNIDDPRFFDLLLRTWIGPVPLSSQFRDGLLVSGNYSEDLQARFNDTRPSDERIEAVAAALNASNEKAKPSAAATVAAVAVAAPKPNVAQPTIGSPAIIKPPVIGTVPIQAPNLGVTEPQAQEQVATDTTLEDATADQQEEASDNENNAEPTETAALVSEELEEEESIIEEEDEVFTAESLLAQQLYIAKLKKWTYKELSYPEKSLQKNEQGTVRMSVTINRKGKVKNIELFEEPEYSRLTQAAVKAVKKSSPYPPIPNIMSDEEFSFTLPIVFKIID